MDEIQVTSRFLTRSVPKTYMRGKNLRITKNVAIYRRLNTFCVIMFVVMENKKNHILHTIFTWVIIISIWHVVTEYGIVSNVMIPSPREVLSKFIEIVQNGYNDVPLIKHIYVSLKRLFIAVILAIVTAIPLGLMSGYLPRFRSVIDSFIHFYRPIPPLGYYTLLVIWMGIDDSSKIMLLFLAAFAPIYLVCVAAVGDVKKDFILSAQSMGATKRDIFYRVVLPASLPSIFTGVRTAIGFSYTTLVSAEMVAATSGLGWMVLDASRYLKTDVIIIGNIIMGISGILIDLGLRKVEKKYVFWKGIS